MGCNDTGDYPESRALSAAHPDALRLRPGRRQLETSVCFPSLLMVKERCYDSLFSFSSLVRLLGRKIQRRPLAAVRLFVDPGLRAQTRSPGFRTQVGGNGVAEPAGILSSQSFLGISFICSTALFYFYCVSSRMSYLIVIRGILFYL